MNEAYAEESRKRGCRFAFKTDGKMRTPGSRFEDEWGCLIAGLGKTGLPCSMDDEKEADVVVVKEAFEEENRMLKKHQMCTEDFMMNFFQIVLCLIFPKVP